MTVDLEILCTWKVHTQGVCSWLINYVKQKRNHIVSHFLKQGGVCAYRVRLQKKYMCLIYKHDDEKILLRDCRWMNFICVVNFMLAWSPNKFRGKGDPS